MHHTVIQRLITACFDSLFPPRHEELLVRTLTKEACTTLLAPQEIHGATALIHYTNPTVRALIHEAKFHNNARAQTLLGTILAAHVMMLPVRENTYIVPIPLSKSRKRSRGYNQVTAILHAACTHATHMPPLADNILVRVRDTRPQTEIHRHERLANVADTFRAKHADIPQNAHYILIDDVITTGATMRAARNALTTHGEVSITCIALAH